MVMPGGKINLKFVPCPGVDSHFDFPVVQLDDPVDHRQTDAASLFLGREIQIENPAEMLRWNADAGVLDVDLDPAPRRRPAAQSSAYRRRASPGTR